MAGDHDAARRLQVVRAEPKPPRSANAEAAARYRARQRGQDVPTRKPGPKPTTTTQLRDRIRDLERQVAELTNARRILEERVRRQVSTLTIQQLCRELLDVLNRDPAERDSPERRVLLSDVRVEIEERHDRWPDR